MSTNWNFQLDIAKRTLAGASGVGLLTAAAGALSLGACSPEPVLHEPEVLPSGPALEPQASEFAQAATSTVTDPPPSTPRPLTNLERLQLPDAEPGQDFLSMADEALKAGQARSALAALRRSLTIEPPTFEVLLRAGRLSIELGENELAVAALEEATATSPEVVEGQIQLARAYIASESWVKARVSARKAARRAPQEAVTWNLLGRAEMGARRWQAAEHAFERGIALSPASPHLHNNLGLLLVRMKRGVEAVDVLETAVALFGDDAPAYTLNNLGLAYELEGELESAESAFEDALGVDPFYVKAQVNLQRVTRARVRSQAPAQTPGLAEAAPAAEVPSDGNVAQAEP